MAKKQKADFAKDTVNLDPLIPREDLRSKKQGAPNVGPIPVSELQLGKNQYHLLRKPIFQRATDDWTIDHVVSLIKSFRDGHLIPAVILWDAEGYTFVIDGAHRLSVFIAWINDDYGDQHITQSHQHDIPKRQKEVAAECRRRVAEAGCAYSALSNLGRLANRTDEQLRYSSNLSRPVETQRVLGDSAMAATSFLAINQRSVQIDATEKYFIEEEDAINVISARAIACNATGYAYWGKFSQGNVQEIERLAKSIYAAIFEPEDAVPKVDTELQPAGQARSANGVRIALDLVNITNSIKGLPVNQAKDLDGDATVRFLQRTHNVVKYVAGNHPASLSLHPAVYFWGATGNHRPSIFLAVISLTQEMIENEELREFTIVRARFEEFLVGNAGIGKQLLGKHGGWKKSVSPVKKLLRLILDGLKKGQTAQEIEAAIYGDPKIADGVDDFEMQTPEKNKWKEARQHARIKASLDSAVPCAICKARLVIADASDDHVVRKADGGAAKPVSQLTHHYCNHGFKEFYAQKGLPLPEISSSTLVDAPG